MIQQDGYEGRWHSDREITGIARACFILGFITGVVMSMLLVTVIYAVLR